MTKRFSGWRRRRRIRLRKLADDPHCFWCGAELTVEWATLDHLIPRAAGGTDEIVNLLLSCGRCNRRKADGPLTGLAAHAKRGCGLANRKHVDIWNRKAARRIADEHRRRLRETVIHGADAESPINCLAGQSQLG